MGEHAEVVLPGGAAARLALRADVAPIDDQRVRILVDGKPVVDQEASAGPLGLRIPLEASESFRRVELEWDKTFALSEDDPRAVAARVEYFDLVPLRSPAALEIPRGLEIPGVEFAGLYSDCWVERESHVVLAGGAAAELAVCGEIPNELDDQRLEVVVDDGVVLAEAVDAGIFNARTAIAASAAERRVVLRWTKTTSPSPDDPRSVAAQVMFVGVVSGHPPTGLRSDVGELLNPNLRHSGLYADGWMGREVVAELTQRPGAELVLRADALPLPGQRVEVAVDGEVLLGAPVSAQVLNVRVAPVGTASTTRRVAIRFTETEPLGDDDPRHVAARLVFLGFQPARRPSAVLGPEGLDDPNVEFGGIHVDGWLEDGAWIVLGGGPAADLVTRFALSGLRAQHVDVLVAGETVASADSRNGTLEARVRLAPSDAPRVIGFQFAQVFPLSASDPRSVSARLEYVGLERPR